MGENAQRLDPDIGILAIGHREFVGEASDCPHSQRLEVTVRRFRVDGRFGRVRVGLGVLGDLDGWLGTGDSLPVSLTAGNHVITATVIDSVGAEPRTLPTITLQVDAATDVPGDVNGDGVIGLGDLWLLQRHIMGMETLDSEAQLRADIAPEGSPDGVVDLGDQLLLMRWLLNP